METGTDHDNSREDYREYVHGDNYEAAKPVQTEIVGDVTVRQFPARSWSATRFTIDNTNPQQIAGALPQRKKLHIINTGANPVFVAPSREQCTVSNGLLLANNGVPLVMTHTAEVWAFCDVALPTDLSVYAEFGDGGTGK